MRGSNLEGRRDYLTLYKSENPSIMGRLFAYEANRGTAAHQYNSHDCLRRIRVIVVTRRGVLVAQIRPGAGSLLC